MRKGALLLLGLTLFAGNALARVDSAPVQWVAHLGGADRDCVTGGAVLPDGSTIVCGWFELYFWSQGQVPPAGLSNPQAFGLRDLFWAKFDPAGAVVWVKSAGSRNCDVASTLSVLPDGTFAHVAAYGYAGKNATFGYMEPNQVVLTAYDNYDIALVRVNADGTLRWARRMGGIGDDWPNDVALAPDGGCYLACFYTQHFHMGDDDGVTGNEAQIEPPDGNSDDCLVYYDGAGAYKWHKLGSYQFVKPLPDNSCVAAMLAETVRCFMPDGSQLWEITEAGNIVAGISTVRDSSDFYVLWNRWTGNTLSKYRIVPGDVPALLWEAPMPANYYWGYSIDATADGFCCVLSPDNTLYAFDADGNLLYNPAVIAPEYSTVGVAPDHGVFLYGQLSGNMVVGKGLPGEVALTYWGSGDIFVGKFGLDKLFSVDVRAAGNGGASLTPAGGLYHEGDVVTALASPNFACHDRFDHWEGDWSGFDPRVTFTVGARDYTATAYFEQLPGAPYLPAATGPALALAAGAIAIVARRRLHALRE